MKAQELRIKAQELTQEEMKNLRDELEANWDESKREIMQILSLACINKFKRTLSSL